MTGVQTCALPIWINDCCTSNTVNEEHGIYLTAGSNWRVWDNKIRDAAANMRYGIFSSTINQPTCSFRNNEVTGASDYGARFYGTSTAIAELSGNNLAGGSGPTLNEPTIVIRCSPRSVRGAAAPADGTYRRGDIVWHSTPAAAGTSGWVCTTAGTPGTWKAMANLAA